MAEASHLLSDHDLVAGAQAGDPQSLNTLISAVRPAVFNYCRSRLASYAGGIDADDVAQEICVAVIRVLPRYQHQGVPFAAFVYAIASNKVADAKRRFSRSAVLVDEMPEQTEPSPTPEESVIAAVDAQVAHQLLDRLPNRMRQVLVLRAAGVSAERVGAELGMSANAVRVAQHRAAAKLRELIEESDEHRQLLDSFMDTSWSRPAA
ncbi:MAG TPA: sigma-70 family RNA polymerase sigma factor [Propionibacteriaceae bacterium]